MAQGQNTKSERILQIIVEDTPSVYKSAGAPLLMANADHDWQDADVYDQFRQAGINGSDEYNAVTQQEVHCDVDFVPYYNLLDDLLLQFVLPVPSGVDDTTAAGVRTRTSRLNQTGRLDRRTFSAEQGTPSNARRATYGLVTSWMMNSQRGENGKCRGKQTMILRKAAENVQLTGWTAQNEVQNLKTGAGYAGGTVAISAQNGGVAQTITPGTDNVAAIQTKIALALNKANGHIVVAGTSQLAGAATIASVAVSGAGLAEWNGTYLYDSTQNGAPVFSKDGTHWLGFYNTVWQFGASKANVGASTVNAFYQNTGGTVSTIPPTGWAVGTAAGGAGGTPPTTSSTAGPTAPAILDITATFSGASVANNAQALIVSPTAGVTVTRTQSGSNGSGAISPTPKPILPDHWKFYRAATLAGLANAAAAAPSVDKWEIKADGLVKPKYQQDRDPSYTSHVDGGTDEVQYSFEVTLPTDATGHCDALRTASKAYVSTPQWWRLEALCPDGVHKTVIDFYGSISGNVPYEYGGNIEERKFTFSLLRNQADGYNFAITTVMAV